MVIAAGCGVGHVKGCWQLRGTWRANRTGAAVLVTCWCVVLRRANCTGAAAVASPVIAAVTPGPGANAHHRHHQPCDNRGNTKSITRHSPISCCCEAAPNTEHTTATRHRDSRAGPAKAVPCEVKPNRGTCQVLLRVEACMQVAIGLHLTRLAQFNCLHAGSLCHPAPHAASLRSMCERTAPDNCCSACC
jgi:hypothetical protein